jgi:hypothetical protein
VPYYPNDIGNLTLKTWLGMTLMHLLYTGYNSIWCLLQRHVVGHCVKVTDETSLNTLWKVNGRPEQMGLC